MKPDISNRFAEAASACLSEADCIAQGLDFSAYAKGVADAIAACEQLVSQAHQPASNAKAQLYLNVPFAEKDKVKALGGRWDSGTKKWYVPHGVDIRPFEAWCSTSSQDAATLEKKSSTKAGKVKPAIQKESDSIKKTIDTKVVGLQQDDGEVDLPW